MATWSSWLLVVAGVFAAATAAPAAPGTSVQRDVPLPAGTSHLWTASAPSVLENGWIVVVDRGFDRPGPPVVPDVGAFHVFEADGTHRFTYAGTSPGEGLTLVLVGGTRAVVVSPGWRDAADVPVGAVMLVDLTEPLPETITPDHAIVGTRAGDLDGLAIARVGDRGVVIGAPHWDRGSLIDAGAVRWMPFDGSSVGEITPANALVGRQAGDRVGREVRAIGDEDWVAFSNWQPDGIFESGAITHVVGGGQFVGEVSADNSLYGNSPGDRIGSGGLVPLPNGSLLVLSPDHDAPGEGNSGAITRIDPGLARSGPIGPANSLVGRSLDRLGASGSVTVLADGHLVIHVPDADRGGAVDVGAVAFRRIDEPLVGTLTPTNALFGSFQLDRIGSGGIRPLADGSYLVLSPIADLPGIVDAGAVTFGPAGVGITGLVSAANSLIGRSVGDRVGSGDATALVNGGAVVLSPNWHSDSGVAGVGAASLIRGSGDTGPVDAGNSLVGASSGDFANAQVIALANGHYVVGTRAWNGLPEHRGAVTWGDSITGAVGAISPTRSLVGPAGSGGPSLIGGLVALDDGHYVIGAPGWRDADGIPVGAAFWIDGSAPATGPIEARLGRATIGTVAGGATGRAIHALRGGAHLVSSGRVETPDGVRTALTWIPGQPLGPTAVDASNSLHGAVANDGAISWPVVSVREDGSWLSMEPRFTLPGISGWLGALSFGWADGSTRGPIAPTNSVIGDRPISPIPPSGGVPVPFLAEDPVRHTVISRRSGSPSLVLLWPGSATTTSLIRLDGPFDEAPIETVVRVWAAESPTGRIEVRDQRGALRCTSADGIPIGKRTIEFRCLVDASTEPAIVLAAEFHGYPRFAFSRSAAVEAGQFFDGFEF